MENQELAFKQDWLSEKASNLIFKLPTWFLGASLIIRLCIVPTVQTTFFDELINLHEGGIHLVISILVGVILLIVLEGFFTILSIANAYLWHAKSYWWASIVTGLVIGGLGFHIFHLVNYSKGNASVMGSLIFMSVIGVLGSEISGFLSLLFKQEKESQDTILRKIAERNKTQSINEMPLEEDCVRNTKKENIKNVYRKVTNDQFFEVNPKGFSYKKIDNKTVQIDSINNTLLNLKSKLRSYISNIKKSLDENKSPKISDLVGARKTEFIIDKSESEIAVIHAIAIHDIEWKKPPKKINGFKTKIPPLINNNFFKS